MATSERFAGDLADQLDTRLHDVTLRLIGGGGVLLPESETLLVADLHLGKDATFRQSGLSVPRGASEATLRRVGGLLERTAAQRLFVLGDLCHAPSSRSAETVSAWRAFRRRFGGVEMTLVRGNHDAGIDDVARDWGLGLVEPGYRLGSVQLHHHPPQVPRGPSSAADAPGGALRRSPGRSAVQSASPSGGTSSSALSLAGHLHPALRVQAGEERLGRFPCFWYRRGCLVLPAAGAFTGNLTVKPSRGDRVWIDLGDAVFAYPHRV